MYQSGRTIGNPPSSIKTRDKDDRKEGGDGFSTVAYGGQTYTKNTSILCRHAFHLVENYFMVRLGARFLDIGNVYNILF